VAEAAVAKFKDFSGASLDAIGTAHGRLQQAFFDVSDVAFEVKAVGRERYAKGSGIGLGGGNHAIDEVGKSDT